MLSGMFNKISGGSKRKKKKLAKPVFHKVLSNEQGLLPSLPLARSILKGLRRVCEMATNGCKSKLLPSSVARWIEEWNVWTLGLENRSERIEGSRAICRDKMAIRNIYSSEVDVEQSRIGLFYRIFIDVIV